MTTQAAQSWLPYGRQSVEQEDIDAVAEVLRGDWLTTGPAVESFEEALAQAVGAPCVSVTSGTAALHVAYAGLGAGPGSEVVTSPFTFIATASSAALLGATVRFADVSDDTLNLDPQAAAALAGERTSVIAAVDYAGHPADLDELRSVADSVGARLLEDAAHSIGARYKGRPVGSVADATCFSFFPTKHMTTAEGGAVAAPDPAVLQAARRFARIGRDPQPQDTSQGAWWYEMSGFGLNYRLPDVLCALGAAQLRRLPAFLARRDELVARYDQLLSGVPGLRLPTRRADVEPAWHLYSVRVLDGRRREVFDRLRAAGIGVQVNYIPVYWHPVFADLGYRRGMCPVAEAAYAEQLSLPLFPDMTDADQDRVVEALRGVLDP
ncbi:DegT/DnrJ/EryC1/StrS family aminotransferase [Motilibacter aurantiacus]|uniref:DegT/DnrJ/EryC1/StrS family aminotransferase n=1 Tax=Motilibacter aurantiacus TaxID=2714955 RepID=UPI00140836AF|nr:aminotransferase class I/II-fold pyridoxal phosphate-dependent enzyme [Motilibacter aurantiacus]NHC46375.1 aminotransferase class I/II-fold pyridoxal phosphate-dependent enzyme [Motilibacter aurantiacus]